MHAEPMELTDTQLNYFVNNRLKLAKGKRAEYLAQVDHLIERFDAAAKGDSSSTSRSSENRFPAQGHGAASQGRFWRGCRRGSVLERQRSVRVSTWRICTTASGGCLRRSIPRKSRKISQSSRGRSASSSGIPVWKWISCRSSPSRGRAITAGSRLPKATSRSKPASPSSWNSSAPGRTHTLISPRSSGCLNSGGTFRSLTRACAPSRLN